MQSIKECCRYQNFLEKTIYSLSNYISNTDNAIKRKETHYKSKSNPNAVDEEIDNTPERTFSGDIVDISYLIKDLINEKLNVSLAIENAKRYTRLNWKENDVSLTLDTGLEHSKKSRELAERLKPLTNLKNSENKTIGSAYKFNEEGNQVTYKYEVEIVKTLNFDKNNITQLYKSLLEKADKLSNEVENAFLKESVDIEFKYSIHDSIEEIVEKFVK